MANATFVGADDATRGNWVGVYGADGYFFAPSGGYPSSLPPYAGGWTTTTLSSYTYAASTTDSRAPQDPANPAGNRKAVVFYSNPAYSLTADYGATPRRLALHLIDWDIQGRTVTADVLDADTSAVLDTRSASGLSGGRWLSWDVTGRVTIRVTKTAGSNATAFALMFSTPAAGGATVALTGQGFTASPGTLTPGTSVALAGQSVAAATGTLAPAVSLSLSGQSFAASPGTLTPGTSVALTGQAVVAAAGSLSPAVSVALSGQEAVAATGTVTPSGGTAVHGGGVCATVALAPRVNATASLAPRVNATASLEVC